MIIVAGFPRCGSSLTMQMLNACGLRCSGEFPAFEPSELRHAISEGQIDAEQELEPGIRELKLSKQPLTREWMEQFDAVKILDPHRMDLPELDPETTRVVWLDRNPIYQSVSIMKFMIQVAGLKVPRNAAGGIVRQMREDLPEALAKFEAYKVKRLRFEDLIENTRGFYYDLCMAVSPHYHRRLDLAKMVDCIRRRTRGVETEPDMHIESVLVAQASARIIDRMERA